ncbi:MAG: DegQ family serine endoprotease [Vicinamibacterales bacterium]
MNGRDIFTKRWRTVGLGTTLGAAVLALVIGTVGERTPLSAAPSAAQSTGEARPGLSGNTESYADLVGRVAPAVVTVRSTRMVQQTQFQGDADDLFRRFFGRDGESQPRVMPRRQAGLGSGVIVRQDGYILTNNHVVDGASKVQVELTDGRSFEAKVVGSDKPSDLAVLKVAATSLPTMPLGDSDRARVGDVVLAIGNPLGVGQTVTMGIVSGKGRAPGGGDGSFEDFIQTDAPINQGNSGGALVNLRGELIGINSQILSPVGFNIGIGFAIPSNMAERVMDQLIANGVVRRGLLGVTVQGLSPELSKGVGLSSTRGAIVTDVSKDGAAARAGIERGDVILELNQQTVDSSNNLRNLVSRIDPGTAVTLKVWRDGRERTVKATLGELPQEQQRAETGAPDNDKGRFGLAIEPLTNDVARQLGVSPDAGVLVADVDPDGPAAEAGIQSGDVIEQVNGTDVHDVNALKSALNGASTDKPVLVLINRKGSHIFTTLSHRG